jgi:flagellar biosynthesis/type III secretory pathway protein FliH
MIETIPNITEDGGFKKDAKQWAENVLRNKTIRIDDFKSQLSNMIEQAYLYGGQNGFRTGLTIGRQEQNKK